MRRVLACLSVVASVACGASDQGASSPTGARIDGDWLDGDEEIEAEHVARVLDLGRHDPEVRALFDEARVRLGGGSVEALARRFSTCASQDANEPGHARLLCEHALLGLELEDVAAGKQTDETRQRIAAVASTPARDMRIETHTDYVLVERTLLPHICVVPRISLADAYEVFVHEFVHSLRYQPCRMMDAARAPSDPTALRQAVVLAPGGEADAYAASVRARLRLGARRSISAPLLDLFDPASGALRVSREQMVPSILAPPPAGLGYAVTRLRDPRAELLDGLVRQLTLRRAFLEELAARRRAAAELHGKNVSVHAHNIDAARHNMGVAQKRGETRMVREWQAKLSASEQGLAETRALIDVAAASEARINTELAELAAQLATLASGGAVGPASGG